MTEQKKIPASDDAWDKGALGRDEDYAKIAGDIDDEAIDNSLELVPMSIRLQRSLIESFKLIAKHNGIGYQPLMRQVLTRFAECEMRQMANDLLEQQRTGAPFEQGSDELRRA